METVSNKTVLAVKNEGFDYEVKFIDSTHLSLKLKSCEESNGTIYQSYQVPDWLMTLLNDMGYIHGNRFFNFVKD